MGLVVGSLLWPLGPGKGALQEELRDAKERLEEYKSTLSEALADVRNLQEEGTAWETEVLGLR